jgi:hypothetical protein
MSYWRLLKRYFTPRRIRIKALLIYTVTFVLLIILIDDYLNTNNDPVSKLAQKNEMDAANALYKRDRFVKHPKDIRIPKKGLDEDTQVDELAVTDKSKNIGNSENLINVQISNEFELPKLNMDRLLSDSKYKESIKAVLFDDTDDLSTLGGDTNSIKECDCFNVQMCKCCLHLNLTSIDFLHYSCAYLTYEKGSKVSRLIYVQTRGLHIVLLYLNHMFSRPTRFRLTVLQQNQESAHNLPRSAKFYQIV